MSLMELPRIKTVFVLAMLNLYPQKVTTRIGNSLLQSSTERDVFFIQSRVILVVQE